MTHKSFTLIVLMVVSGVCYGQFTGQIATNMSSGGAAQGEIAGAISTLLGPISDANTKRAVDWEKFQGSPYVSNEFQDSDLYYKNEKIGPVFYRYNALNEEIEVKESKLQQGVRGLSTDKYVILMIDGKAMSFKTFIDKNGNTLNGYLTMLVDGKDYDLFRRTLVKFTQGSPAPNSFVKATPSRFTQFTEYYVQKEGVNRIDELVQKNSKVYKLDPGKKDAVKQYIKDYSLNLDQEEDMIKIVQFLNRES